jgi:hypothetical protein
MKRTHLRSSIALTTGAKGIVAHAGARLLYDLADDVGATEALSDAMAAPTVWRTLESIDEETLARIGAAQAKTRKHA